MPLSYHAVASWTSPQGLSLGVLVEEPSHCFLGNRDQVLKQLKQTLQERFKEYPWLEASPDPEPQVHWIKIALRPEIRHEGKRFPQEQVCHFNIPCVVIQDQDGGLQATLPHLGSTFFYQKGRDLKELVNHFVQEQLGGVEPAQLATLIPPNDLEVQVLRLKVEQHRKGKAAPEMPHLTQIASRLSGKMQRCYGRQKLTEELLLRLREGASVLLVGGSGVGKSGLVQEAARTLKTLWQSSAHRVVAGMKYLGQWEERLEAALEELREAKGVLAFESLMPLLQQGGSEPSGSIAALLAPSLEQGEVQLVVEATPEEWLAAQRLLGGFVDLFQVLQVEAMDESQTLQVMAQLRQQLEQSRRTTLSPALDAQIVRLVRRFQPYLALPGGAARWLRTLSEFKPGGQVGLEGLFLCFSEETGVPEAMIRDDLTLTPQAIHDTLARQILGQPQALEVATRVLTTLKAGLNDPERPLAVLLLCGPTGVGKTELAKCLTRYLFGDVGRLIRLDMSEYASPGSAERLLGSVFDEEPSPLIRRVRRQPFSVVLLDEVEKADPEVFDVLLRVMDEGRLSDAYGRTTHFQSCLILMTSNLGAGSKPLGLRQNNQGASVTAAQRFFRPEFLNRIDALVEFEALSSQRVAEIAQKEIDELQDRVGLKQRGIRLRAKAALLEKLVQEGYDARYGARPLQRALENLVVSAISRTLLSQTRLRDVTLELDWNGQEVLVYPV